MPKATLTELLERNERHTSGLSADYFADVETSQSPAVVSVSCSDSRVSQEGMWDVDEPGWLFTVGNIGNQVWDDRDGERVVSGDVVYPVRFTDTRFAAVVGHTGCGAITAALEAVQNDEKHGGASEDGASEDGSAEDSASVEGASEDGSEENGDGEDDMPAGVAKRVESLRPVVEAGLTDDRVVEDGPASLVNQLVEYNVDRQVEFLLESDDVPVEETVAGFVYDFQAVYGDVRGRCYLVTLDGETDPAALRERVPDDYEDHVERLLSPR